MINMLGMYIKELAARLPKRLRVLLMFILFTSNNGFSWLMFDPVAGWLEKNVKGLNRAQLEWLSSWQPIVFLCMCVPFMKIVTRSDGLRVALLVGTTAEIAGAGLKFLGALCRRYAIGLVFLNMGQIFSGIGSPVATGAVSALSATWFPPEERTRATAAAVLFNSVGNALCYILVPLLTNTFGFTSVTVYEFFMALLALWLTWRFFPRQITSDTRDLGGVQSAKNADHVSPSQSSHDTMNVELYSSGCKDGESDAEIVLNTKRHNSLFADLVTLLSNWSCICLLIVYAWLCGGFSAWISLFAATYNTVYDEQFIGVMSFAGVAAYVIGGLVSSCIVDMYFSHQMKYVIFFCISMNTLSNLVFVASTPNDKGFCLWKLGKGFIIFSVALCGFWNGAAAPLFYELIAEISFPVEEGVSGTCLSIMENIGALVFYQVVSRFFHGQSMSVAYSFGMTVAVVMCAAAKQRYRRTFHAYLMNSRSTDST